MVTKIREWINEKKYDGVLLSRRDNYTWVTGGNEHHVLSTTAFGVGHLLITPQDLIVFADCSDARRIKDEQNNLQAQIVEIPWYENVDDKVRESICGKNIVSDSGMLHTPNVQAELVTLRLILTEREISLYREVGREAAEIVESVCRAAMPGQTEIEIATMVKTQCLEQGISPDCVLVGVDDRILKYRHPMPTKQKLKQSLMVVLGGEKYGLNVSMTRFVFFGSIPEDIQSKYEKLQYIFTAMQCMMKDGMTGNEYFQKVKALYKDAGFEDEWKLHHQGGSTGYACREVVMKPTDECVVRRGQAYAWNPTITGVKCEETTFLSENGIEVFTRTGTWPVKTIETPYGTMDVVELLKKD